MIVLGLTGSIGMGKSTAAAMLRGLRVPLFDADQVVHRLMAPGGAAAAAVAAAFPGVHATSGKIDRRLLGQRVFADPQALSRLERIIHPMVAIRENQFLARARSRRQPIAVLDVPLLFETGGERRCDYVLVVSAPAFLQRQRVMRRAGMTESRLAAIAAKQLPDPEKRRRADFVIRTGLGRNLTLRRVRAIIRVLHAARSRFAGKGRGALRQQRRGR